MKLRDLFALMEDIRRRNNVSPIWICGGVARDKVRGQLNQKSLSDIDLTTGDATVHTLARETAITLSKQYNITTKKADDGHTSVLVGNTKLDFSSNFITLGIDNILNKMGVENITDLQKEMWSRDFTANSLLLSLDLKTIKDPTHRGIQDIKNKILRTCLTPDITFRSNPNRIIRTIYFAAKLGFKIDPEIEKWIMANKDIISTLRPGYVSKTIKKAMDYDKDRTVGLIEKLGLRDVLSVDKTAGSAPAFFRKNFDYGAVDDKQNRLPPEVSKKFEELAQMQRGEPEQAMLRATRYIGGGVLPIMLEHIGDLIHRMSENTQYGYTGYGPVKEKVDRAKRYLEREYGFTREMEENFRANAEYRKIPFDEYMANVKLLLAEYVRAHKALPTYNTAQRCARWAAIDIGELKPREALIWIYRLDDMLKSKEEWKKHAWEYDPAMFPSAKEDEKEPETKESADNMRIELLKKVGYFAGNPYYGAEFYPFDDFYYPGQTSSPDEGNSGGYYFRGYNPRLEDRQRDGKEFEEFAQFRKKRKNRFKRLKLLRKLLKEHPQQQFVPTPFYENLYGGSGTFGINSYPAENYGSTIADGPDANTNPFYETYQMNSLTG